MSHGFQSTRSLRPRLSYILSAGLCLSLLTLPIFNVRADEPSTENTQTEPAASAAPLNNIYKVSGSHTPSGFDVPRFVSLKFGKVNARTGPSRNHPIAYQYQRRGLPLLVVAETEMWRKVSDIHGDEAWVHKPALSGKRFAVLTADSQLYKKPDRDARMIARIARGTLVHLGDCQDTAFCRVRTQNGIKGFTPRHTLWGAQTLN